MLPTFLNQCKRLAGFGNHGKLKPVLAGLAAALTLGWATGAAAADTLSQAPLYISNSQAPLVLLTMARDHKLYFEAYNDYSDLDGDGTLDIGYKPAIDYYGYFDSHKCYEYSAALGRFVPDSVTLNKKCVSAWSGDFLNYVTTSRMDALRKVLYGGSRDGADTTALTVLERVFIPQDAHSWGKEYQSVARDGYAITDYTPFPMPEAGNYHIFANTSLSSDPDTPVMRVLNNTKFRVWEWLSIESPVAGFQCNASNSGRTNCAVPAANAQWELVPAGIINNVSQSTYNAKSYGYNSPIDILGMGLMEAVYAQPGNLCGTRSLTQINGTGNPFPIPPCDTSSDRYFDMITGTINVPVTGSYRFAVDGDDAVDLQIQVSGLWLPVASYYGSHGVSNGTTHNGYIALQAGVDYPFKFRHQDGDSADGYYLYWQRNSTGSQITDYQTRVEVCNKNVGLESNCQAYSSGGVTSYKPVGLLQKNGANNAMYFGLLSGSYTHNTEGGVLRKAISTINNEITPDGRFGRYAVAAIPGLLGTPILGTPAVTAETCSNGGPCVNGIISTVNKFKITGFTFYNNNYNCFISTRQMVDGECQMWGNPLGEMVYEGMRYFAGKTTPSAAFMYPYGATTASQADNQLGLPLVSTWSNPYSTTPDPTASTASFAACSKPYNLLISDIYPSFDSNSMPGIAPAFGSYSGTTDLTGFSAFSISQQLWNNEFGNITQNVFIGQVGSNDSGIPTAKAASTFGNIRGLSPGEPTRQGSYYSAAAAYYGRTTAMNPLSTQKVNTYSIALAAPLPKLEIPVSADGKTKVTIMPFAKSVNGNFFAPVFDFKPTNQIADFYVEMIRNVTGSPTDATINGGRPYYKFRINYEDQEQGSDFDMDSIALYEIKLNVDNTVSVVISSDYAAGAITQHMGFTISGTSNDGAYLLVRDTDTAEADDYSYVLDCGSSTNNPADCVHTGKLPLFKELKFTPVSGTTTVALNDPLWYAAKYGSFADTASGPATMPASNAVPDNYFLVTNPLTLETQLAKAFAQIAKTTSASAATSTNSFSYQTNSALYQARFLSEGWAGELQAYPIGSDGTLGLPTWQAQKLLASRSSADRTILTYDPGASAGARGIPFKWSSMKTGGVLQTSLNKNYLGTVDIQGSARVSYLRGDTVAGMRTRPVIDNAGLTNKLGDIISSQPQYVSYPSAGLTDATYAAFRVDYLNRTPMVYVGANDGMMHGFSAVDGSEKMAYVPSQMYRTRGQPLLSKLTDVNYGLGDNPHHYYVDGTLAVNDVCANPCASKTDWKTIAVGGLNGGGQGIYALNVTDPSKFTEGNAASTVLWEFNDSDDIDTSALADPTMNYALGYTFSQPAIVQVCKNRVASSTTVPKACAEGRWVVIFGNGYNNTEGDGSVSPSGFAVLYVLDANTGAVLKKINTRAGS
ncbi:MAG: PilC/PilY family type IV pilus protein, partial [Janthinobacterium lividum]